MQLSTEAPSNSLSTSTRKNTYCYNWNFKNLPYPDIGIYEITRAFEKPNGALEVDLPFTVVIHEYSIRGDQPLFPSLFFARAWDAHRGTDGNVSSDVQFCIELWKELKLPGEFTPDCLVFDYTRVPIVYRRSMEQAMNHIIGIANHSDCYDQIQQ